MLTIKLFKFICYIDIAINSNVCIYRIMSTGWVDGELKRIAVEMLTCEAAANILVVETGTLVALPARCRTVQTWSGVQGCVRLIQSTQDWSCRSVANSSVTALPHDAWMTADQPQTGKNEQCDFTNVKHRFTFKLWTHSLNWWPQSLLVATGCAGGWQPNNT